MTQRERLYELMDRYQRRECSPQEEQELALLCLIPANQPVLEELAARLWEEVEMGKEMPGGEDLLEKILRRPVVRRMMWWKVAVVVILVVAGWLLVRGPGSGDGGRGTGDGGPETGVVADVSAPASNKARVTLSDGQIVSLDSLQKGLIAIQSGVELIKQPDGKLIYQVSGLPTPDSGPLTNTLTNPRGSKVIDLVLGDGSHIWLNAGSSITYPIVFPTSRGTGAGNERRVEITGEAYFEVAPDATRSFIVKKGDMSVTVLGTHFNVNAYDDEADIRVTLLEGRVKVSRSEAKDAAASRNSLRSPREIVLTPGQQAIAPNVPQTSDPGLRTTNPDLEQVMAWKNGVFKFHRTDLKIIMREIARWYDVEVSYEGNVPEQLYNGDVSRTVNVSEVLKILEYTGAHFKVDGRRIIVKP